MTRDKFRLFVGFAISGSTVKRALKVACIVTPILTIFNHAHEIIALDMGPRFFLQVGLTFCVPYMVSTYSSAMTEVKNAGTLGGLNP
ncbi:MAG: nitrate/nitrite transporter NrtS [SAR324 cluster bacterium]|nr:nitrate/nitrite transporter NrtS [SAR324 cluster bacterium]